MVVTFEIYLLKAIYICVLGAFNITKKAQEISMAAQKKVDSTDVILDQSEITRQEVDIMIELQHQEFERKTQENEKNLKEVTDQILGLDVKITDINEMVRSKSASKGENSALLKSALLVNKLHLSVINATWLCKELYYSQCCFSI